MQRALAGLEPQPDCLLIDALSLPGCGLPLRPIIKGDLLCMSVAAASIVAKVTRDRLMAVYHRQFPHYNFLSHKGYSTEEHLQQLATHGPCVIHRRTYAPVAEVIAQARRPPAGGVAGQERVGEERDNA